MQRQTHQSSTQQGGPTRHGDEQPLPHRCKHEVALLDARSNDHLLELRKTVAVPDREASRPLYLLCVVRDRTFRFDRREERIETNDAGNLFPPMDGALKAHNVAFSWQVDIGYLCISPSQ